MLLLALPPLLAGLATASGLLLLHRHGGTGLHGHAHHGLQPAAAAHHGHADHHARAGQQSRGHDRPIADTESGVASHAGDGSMPAGALIDWPVPHVPREPGWSFDLARLRLMPTPPTGLPADASPPPHRPPPRPPGHQRFLPCADSGAARVLRSSHALLI